MRACPGMATRDYLQMVNSLLKHAGKSFASFICSPLQRMGTRELRFWCPFRSRWFRRQPTLTQKEDLAATLAAEPEIPDNLFDTPWDKILLLLTIDQASTGWGSCHFLSSPGYAKSALTAPGSARHRKTLVRSGGGMNLLLDFVGDPFHRSWNDWKWACRHARGTMMSSQMQITVVYNHNYQPYLNGANLTKKQEF